MNKILSYRFSIYIPLFVLFFVLVLNSTPPLEWGYDEFGTIVSHLELDNPDFNNIYRGYFVELGITNPVALEFIINYILPLIIVPVRWTYALGISPILGFSRFVEIDWPMLGFILLMPHIIVAILGAFLVSQSISKTRESCYIFILFISFVLLSHPFLKWTLTLTSYSHHLFCFGLLIYSETQLKETNKFFSKLTIFRSIIQLFNYQYIVIVAVIGLYQFVSNFRIFFKNKIYLNWILPAITALISIIFIVLRAIISGKHMNPSYIDNTEVYNFSANSDGAISSIQYVINRFIDFINYFFVQKDSFYGGSNDSDFSIFLISTFVVVCFFIYFKVLNKISLNVKKTLILIIFSLLIPYLLSIQPFVATRHSLVFFLPIALVFSYSVAIFLEFFFKKKIIILGSLLFLLISALNAIALNNYKTGIFNIEETSTILSKYSVNQIVLSPCDFEPLLYNTIRSDYAVFYRCGPKIISKVNPDENRIAIFAKQEMLISTAKEIISDYSLNEWILIDKSFCSLEGSKEDSCKSNFFIFDRVINSD
jgi:hypothetical protein